MLIICVSCKKVIGCGLTKDGLIANQCCYCHRHYECKEETPTNTIVERKVLFIHFPNDCLDHDVTRVGFKLDPEQKTPP